MATTDKRLPAPLRRLTVACSRLETVLARDAKFGAGDTEPRANIAACLLGALDPEDSNGFRSVPRTAEAWELYSDMPGASGAARRLTTAVEHLIQALKAVPLGMEREAKKIVGRCIY